MEWCLYVMNWLANGLSDFENYFTIMLVFRSWNGKVKKCHQNSKKTGENLYVILYDSKQSLPEPVVLHKFGPIASNPTNKIKNAMLV